MKYILETNTFLRRQQLKDRFEILARALDRIEWTDSVSNAFDNIKASMERIGAANRGFRCSHCGARTSE